ncbi:MAG: NACHT domain-containing protein [Candidatus Lokiarchaeota archaeon]|nr:NACHT domain-containing protein [Candidatus Lokiarchaeota archaeon]
MGSKQTKYQLQTITDYFGFESFCNDLMIRLGFNEINPLGGFKDKGRDAIHFCKKDSYNTIFSYSVRKDWQEKLFEDLDKIKNHNHNCDQVYFVTTSEISANDIDKTILDVLQIYGWTLEIIHLERLATYVDGPYSELKNLHKNIFFLTSEQNIDALGEITPELNVLDYAKLMIERHNEWQEKYTPLLAKFREFEIFAVDKSEQKNKRVPVLEIPQLSSLVILLGESGAGKTTALWKLTVDLSNKLIRKEESLIPVIVSLRNWSEDFSVRQLIQNEFNYTNESFASVEAKLNNGNMLISFDGINELPTKYDSKDYARRDLENFIHKYRNNKYIITCRTPDYDPIFQSYYPDITAPCFEIQRLDQDSIADYIKKYFKDDANAAENLIQQLDLYNNDIWEKETSFVNLARIPLHLYMIILKFRKSGELPSNKAKMLRTFVFHMVERDKSKQAAQLNIEIKEQILGKLAYESIKADYYLSIPKNFAHKQIKVIFQFLRNRGEIDMNITFDNIWRELLSNNFLVKHRDYHDNYGPLSSVQWLHQMIFDYFLACEIINVLLFDSEKEKRDLLDIMRSNPYKWGQACQIALGLVTYQQASIFIEMFVDNFCYKTAQNAFKDQNEDDAYNLSKTIIEKFTFDNFWDEDSLSKISLTLPYIPFVSSLIESFKRGDENDRVKFASIVSKIVIKHYKSEGAKIGEEILQSWIHNKNEGVRFYAAKGYWERDKGLSAMVLKKLLKNGSSEIQQKVLEFMEEWGIN